MDSAIPDDGVELSARIQAVIETYMAENGGGMLTNFILMASYIDADGARAWMMRVPQQQGLFDTLGLVEWTAVSIRNEANNYFNRLQTGEIE